MAILLVSDQHLMLGLSKLSEYGDTTSIRSALDARAEVNYQNMAILLVSDQHLMLGLK